MTIAEPYKAFRTIVIVLLAAIAGSACEVKKTSNPLSPTVAGPIPGVNITTPILLEPGAGQKIAVDKQPITLLIQNAATNGVRPLSYTFEIATDSNFTTKVFTKDKVVPGTDGRTSLKLPDALATGKTYYWRALAQDGANTGSYTPTANFAVYTPIVLEAPAPFLPAANSTTASIRPTFVVNNAPRSGPVGAIQYVLELAYDAGFTNKVTSWLATETPTQTTTSTPDLKYSTTYYWHVRAYEATFGYGPWGPTVAFTTPADAVAAPAPPVGGAPNPGGGGGGGQDAFNLAAAVIQSSPTGVASWPVTTKITSLSVRTDGIAVEFSKKSGPGRWPDVVPPGWSGPLQYTLWIALNIGGTWHTCSPIEFWYGLAANGGDITVDNQIAKNWTYYCGPMARQPAVGEMVGFFVTAGDQRLKDAHIIHERSNVVLIPFPAAAGQTFSF